MEPSPFEPGEVLLGRYVVERVIGAGGMGVVISAVHQSLGERVAIKFLSRAVTDAAVVARFIREARAAARLRSEHVARVTDVGTLDDGLPYMIMEFLDGNDAAEELERRGALPIAEAVDYVLQACEGLAEAHSLGIVHRDVKPANLFLASRPGGRRSVKIIDFGIAKSIEAPSSLTLTSSVIGSPLYMSPEQIRNAKNVDPRGDVWSLGVTCYELVSNARPFNADSLHGTLASIIADAAVPLRSVRPDAPAALDAALARCFEKDIARRYANVAELAAALAPFGGPQAARYVQQIESVLGPAKSGAAPAPTSTIDGASAPLIRSQALTGEGWTTGSSVFRSPARKVALAALIACGVVAGGAVVRSLRVDAPPHAADERSSASSVPSSAPFPAVEPSAAVRVAPSSAPSSAPVPVETAAAAATPRAGKSVRKPAAKPRASADAPRPVVIEGRKF